MQSVNPDAVTYPRAAAAEESLLGILILHPNFIRQVREVLPPEQMMTAFNRGLYRQILDRDRQGLLVELAFLAADYDEAGMAYITRMVKDVGDRIVTPEEVSRCAAIIREEYSLRHMSDPASASDEDIQAMMEALRKRKQGN
jgi:DNA primase